MDNIDELEREIEQITMTRTTDEWIEIIDKAGVPGGQVLTFDETLNDPHVLARDMVAEVEHPIIGPMRTIGPPTKFSDMEYAVRGPAPWLASTPPRSCATPASRTTRSISCSPTACSSTPTPS